MSALNERENGNKPSQADYGEQNEISSVYRGERIIGEESMSDDARGVFLINPHKQMRNKLIAWFTKPRRMASTALFIIAGGLVIVLFIYLVRLFYRDAIMMKKQTNNKANTWVTKVMNLVLPILYAIAIVVAIGMMFYLAVLLHQSAKLTMNTLLSYVCLNLASSLVLVAAFFSSQKRWVKLIVSIAINLFLFGMFFQLLSQI